MSQRIEALITCYFIVNVILLNKNICLTFWQFPSKNPDIKFCKKLLHRKRLSMLFYKFDCIFSRYGALVRGMGRRLKMLKLSKIVNLWPPILKGERHADIKPLSPLTTRLFLICDIYRASVKKITD